MARKPSYPEEAPVGDPVGKPAGDSPDRSETVVAEAEAVKAAAPGRTRTLVTGAAIGVGSAALVAALLYANRSRKGGGGEAG